MRQRCPIRLRRLAPDLADGQYSFNGKVSSLAGQRYKLKIKGEFVSPTKVVEKVTIEKGKCKKTKTFTPNEF